MARREYAGAAPETSLASGISDVATSYTVVGGGGSGYPTGAIGPFFTVVDPGLATEEKILNTSRATDAFSCAGGRGADGTVAVAHSAGAKVRHVFTKTDADEANAHVNAATGVHGRTSALVAVDDAQTLTAKSMSGALNTFSAIPQSAINSLVADLAAKVDDSQIHANWLTALALSLGTNWAAAMDANLDADAATVLAAMGTGWPAVLAAVPDLFNPANTIVQVFTADGTWNKPAGCKAVDVEIIGGGGSGGGLEATGVAQSGESGGGGGGEYARGYFLAAALGATVAVDIGAGGAASVAGGAGNSGATTSFGAHLTALGGAGGALGLASGASAAIGGGVGGSGGTGGHLRIPGQAGGTGVVLNGADSAPFPTRNCTGGASHMSSEAVPSSASPSTSTPGRNYGGGSSGVSRFNNGSAMLSAVGGDGICIVTSYL